MDHKVSKDMISSGMIPSGEKTQADLSRTQYGSVPSPSKLMDAYKSMYETKEEVINEHHKKDADGNTIPHEGEEINEAIQFLPMLAKVAKIATKAATRTGIKLGGKTGGKMVKSAIKNPLNTAANVSLATNLIPKPGVPEVEKKPGTAGMRSATTQYASADLFDIVKWSIA